MESNQPYKTNTPDQQDQRERAATASEIQFPYEPTPQQIQILRLITQTIKSSKNCLIESATGTGKTLCLLASCLTAVNQGMASRVYYLTRTHSQMECILKQLMESKYKSSFALVQSKKGLCANQEVLKKAGSCSYQQFQTLCGHATNTNKDQSMELGIPYCPLKLNIKPKNSKHEPAFGQLYYGHGPRTSIKEIKLMAKNQGICPSTLESFFGKQAELVIMSYKYVCDSILFQNKGLSQFLRNSVVIFDQAHNILQIAKDQSSFELRPFQTEKTKLNIQDARKKFQARIVEGEKMDQQKPMFFCMDEIQNYTKQVENMMAFFEEVFSKSNNSKSKFVLVQMEEICGELLNRFKLKNYSAFYRINRLTIQSLIQSIDPISVQQKKSPTQKKKKKKNYIQSFSKFCYRLSTLINSRQTATNFICALSKQQNRSGSVLTYKLKVNFVCLTSKYTFKRLRDNGAKSIIFASGTLNHSEFAETQLEFLNYFQRQSNFLKKNISLFVINKLRNQPLQILSDSRKSQEKQIIEILQTTIPKIPYGVLVFFKSYDHMQKIQNFIFINSVSFGNKSIFWEHRRKIDHEYGMKEYLHKAQTKQGAVLMAVCRGKASEGYNFKDNLARAVFIVGYPLMSFDCLAYRVKEKTLKNATKLSKWYYDDAMVAVNQAIGRAIRHPRDFASIYLVGQKLYEKRRSLPSWVLAGSVYQGYELSNIVEKTKDFFAVKESQNAFDCPILVQQDVRELAQENEESQQQESKKQSVKKPSSWNSQPNKSFVPSYKPHPTFDFKERPDVFNRQIVPAPTRKSMQSENPNNYFQMPIKPTIEKKPEQPFRDFPKMIEPIPKPTLDSDEQDELELIRMMEANRKEEERIRETTEKSLVHGKRPMDEDFSMDQQVLKKPRFE